jgi:hypothetical protein
MSSSIETYVARALLALALLAGAALSASAQVTTGNLQGIVTDPNQAAVVGATVRVTNVETNQSRDTTTNEQGFYRFTNLLPGQRYRVEVTAAGFAPTTLNDVPVRLAQENGLDIQVQIAGVGETVQVTSETLLLDTAQSQTSQTFTPEQVTQLPYSGSIDNLALLTPGVTAPPTGFAFANGVEFSANGNRTRSNNFQLDGQDNNDNSVAGPVLSLSNQEAIGQYQIITNNFSAEFGRNAGAQINTVTRSGTNNFHGSVFEFHQNSALDARNNLEKQAAATFRFLGANGFPAFANEADRVPSPYRNNRFGGSLGGPVYFPRFGEGGPTHYSGRDRAFFFATFQRDVTRGETFLSSLGGGTFLPTASSAQFAAARFPNPATAALVASGRSGGPTTATGQGTLFVLPPVEDTNGDGIPDTFVFGPGGSSGLVTPGFFAPLAVTTATAAGGPPTTIFGGEAVRFRQANSSNNQFITRLDFNATDRDVITARYIYDRTLSPLGAGGSTIAGSREDYADRTNNLGVTYTRTLSSASINEARFNYSNLFVTFGNTGQVTQPNIAFSGTANVGGSGLNQSFGTDPSFPQSRRVITYQFQDTLSTTRGNHGLKFGADIRRQNVDNFFLPFFLGGFTFTGSTTSTTTAGALPPGTFFEFGGAARTGPATAFENFLLGRPRTINFTLGQAQAQTHENDFYFFVQDDWRVRPTLTLNLGVRYEVSTSPYNPLISQLNEREANAATSIFPAGFPVSARTMQEIPADTNNIAPRVGFAWQPNFGLLGNRFREGRTVIRGGYGISYDPLFFNIVLNTITNSPFVARGSFVQTPGAAGSVAFPFLPTTTAQLATTPSTAGGDPRLFNRVDVDPDLYNPYSMQWHIGIQQELFRNGVLEVRYAGSRYVGQFQNTDANPRTDYLNQAGTYLGLGAGAFTSGVTGTARAGTTGNGRVDPNFAIIQRRINGAQSIYHGLQTRFDMRLRRNFSANVNYTFSRAIDNSSEVFSTLSGGQTVNLAQNPFDQNRGERGLSAFHQKHAFSSNFVLELPWMREQRGFLGRVLGGWQANGIVLAGSGRPYTAAQFFGRYDPLLTGSLRPFNGNPNAPEGTIAFGSFAAENVLGRTGVPAGQFVVLNTRQPGTQGTIVATPQEAMQQSRLVYNDFGLVPAFGLTSDFFPDLEAFNFFRTPFGDVGRNTFLGEPQFTVNFGLFKTTNITEDVRLEFRAEAFNLLNHRNFGVPDPITEDAFLGFNVGSFQNPGYNEGDRRTLRFGLRLLF